MPQGGGGLGGVCRHTKTARTANRPKVCCHACFSRAVVCCQLPKLSIKNEKAAQTKFSGRISRGHPGVVRADIPAQNFGQGPLNPGKTGISARTSMTRRRGRPRPQGSSKNFGQDNFGLNFRSLIKTAKNRQTQTPRVVHLTFAGF